jgi:ribosomal protein S7|nr:hypothetical protein [Actinophrys sol]
MKKLNPNIIKAITLEYNNIPDELLPFKNKIRKHIFSIRNLYLTVASLSEYQIIKIKNFIQEKIYLKKNLKYNCSSDFPIKLKKKKKLKLKQTSIELNSQLNYYYLYNYGPYNVLLHKMANLLMKHGHKSKAFKILLKFFEILKLKLHISNPFETLIYLLFYNLVPIIHVRSSNKQSKKPIGIPIDIIKRLGITLKVFIKGVSNYKMPIEYALVSEYLSLLNKTSYLQEYNKKILKEIQVNKLYKCLNLQDSEDNSPKMSLTPEMDSLLEENNPECTLENLVTIDWENFGIIVQHCKVINAYESYLFQQVLLLNFKRYLILRYSANFISFSLESTLPDELIIKYKLNDIHKVFTYDYLDKEYLVKRRKTLKINENKFKILYDENDPTKIIGKILLNKDQIEDRNYGVLNVEIDKIVAAYTRRAIFEPKFRDIRYNGRKFTYEVSDYKNKFMYYKNNPEYSHLTITDDEIMNYVVNNMFNFEYFPIFVKELARIFSLDLNIISEEDLLLLFLGTNNNFINLKINKNLLNDIPGMLELLDYDNIWKNESFDYENSDSEPDFGDLEESFEARERQFEWLMHAYKKENLKDLKIKNKLTTEEAGAVMESMHDDFLDLEENKAFKPERLESNKLKKLYYRVLKPSEMTTILNNLKFKENG